VSPENLKKDQGWLAASTEAIAANSHCLTSLRPCGLPTARYANDGHQQFTSLAQMKQYRTTLKDRDASISQPRHLTKGLVRKMFGIPIAKWHAIDAIGQPSFFHCPTHTEVTHIASRSFGNPIESGENQIGHFSVSLLLNNLCAVPSNY
jgi:hypothetical protein